ncbi:hypothetical protein DL98DRAFT_513648 [Cadophora sp. DSE1049]|nr:hypothetical protein DL98DRAFT_513648 [Cadophora sp. DSE1049]
MVRHWSLGRMREGLRLAEGVPLQVEEDNEEEEVHEKDTRRSVLERMHDALRPGRSSVGRSVDLNIVSWCSCANFLILSYYPHWGMFLTGLAVTFAFHNQTFPSLSR